MSVNCRSLGWTVDDIEAWMRRSSGRRPAAATGSTTDGFTVVAVAVAIEPPGGSGMWNEGEQAAGSGYGCKYLAAG